MKATFYDALFSGLVPVRELSRRSDARTRAQFVRVEVVKTHGPYKEGEVMEIRAHELVVKSARQYGAFIRVDTAPAKQY
jgi:hypothetical protein